MPGSFSPSRFDPALILGQIIAMQSLAYTGLGMWLLLLSGITGRPATSIGLAHVFSCSLRLSHAGRWVTITAFLLNALASGCFLAIVVERAKNCLDFAATAHALHLCGCVLYDGFPKSWEWWFVNLACVALMALLGEYLCMRRELRDIPLGRLR